VGGRGEAFALRILVGFAPQRPFLHLHPGPSGFLSAFQPTAPPPIRPQTEPDTGRTLIYSPHCTVGGINRVLPFCKFSWNRSGPPVLQIFFVAPLPPCRPHFPLPRAPRRRLLRPRMRSPGTTRKGACITRFQQISIGFEKSTIASGGTVITRPREAALLTQANLSFPGSVGVFRGHPGRELFACRGSAVDEGGPVASEPLCGAALR